MGLEGLSSLGKLMGSECEIDKCLKIFLAKKINWEFYEIYIFLNFTYLISSLEA